MQYNEDFSEKGNGYYENINRNNEYYSPVFTNQGFQGNNTLMEKVREKKEFRRVSDSVGIAFLITVILSLLWTWFIYYLIKIPIFDQLKIINLLNEPGFQQVEQILYSIILFTVPFIIVFKCRGYYLSGLISFGKSKKGTALPVFLFGVAFSAFSNIAVAYSESLFRSFGIKYKVNYGDTPNGLFGFLLSLLSTAIIPALLEEFACRGLVLGLLRKYGDMFAVVASAAMFGLIHGNFEQIPFAFLMGLLLGYAVILTGSIRVSILIHFFNNFVSLLFDTVLKNLNTVQINVIYTLFLTISLLFGIIIISVSDKKIFTVNKNDTKLSNKEKAIWFSTSIPVIIFALVCVAKSFQFFY